MAPAQNQELFPDFHNPDGLWVVNDRCLVRTQHGHRVVIVSGIILAQYALTDSMAEAYAMISLVEQGWADQNDVARAFGCAARTLRRQQRRFDEGGLAALGRKRGYPPGRARLATCRIKKVQQLRAEGNSYRQIARVMGVSAKAIRKLLHRSGWKEPAPIQPELGFGFAQGGDPKLSAFCSQAKKAPPTSYDTDPSDRGPTACWRAWGYWRMPRRCLVLPPQSHGREFCWPCPSWSPVAYSSARKKFTARLGRPFMGCAPVCSRCCSWPCGASNGRRGSRNIRRRTWAECWVWTGRPKSKRCGANWPAWRPRDAPHNSGEALAQQRVALRGEALGFLYTDGHVRVYHGQHPLPKAHVARMRISLPATSDYWVNDSAGDPLFVVTAEANAGLVKMLPGILAQVRALVGKRRLTVVFDRGGYSPKLFQ